MMEIHEGTGIKLISRLISYVILYFARPWMVYKMVYCDHRSNTDGIQNGIQTKDI